MLNLDAKNELNTQIQYRLVEKLTESERRYRTLVENLREIVFECTISEEEDGSQPGRLIFINKAWEATLGYTKESTIGFNIAAFIADEDTDKWQTFLASRQLNGPAANTEIDSLEIRFKHCNGEILWLEVAMQQDGSPTAAKSLSGSLINITERKRAEALMQKTNEELERRVAVRTTELTAANETLQTTLHQLQKTQGQLIQTEKMSGLGQLVAGVAHEINNPINFVHGNLKPANEYAQDVLDLVNLYQQHYPDPVPEIQNALEEVEIDFIKTDFPRLLTSMRSGTSRIQGIVKSLRNFSRLDEVDTKTADLHEGIDNTLLILNGRLRSHPHLQAIEVNKQYGVLPLVECYPGQLNQVFMNLLVNAIDALEVNRQAPSAEASRAASGTNPIITIRTQVEDGYAIIAIADNGCGIPETVKAKLFDPFFTTKPVGKGTGLGLSISYQIVTETHQGQLLCESSPEKGTTFSIRIPLRVGTPSTETNNR